MEKIEIGKITGAVGLKGEVKVYNYSTENRYDDLNYIYINKDTKKNIENARHQKNMIVLKLEGIDDRDAAEKVRGSVIYIDETQLPTLPEGEFYIKDLIGLHVTDITTGRNLGTIKDVLQNTAQDVYVIQRENSSDLLVPVVKEFVKDINLETGIKLELIPGFLDEDYYED